MEPDSTPTPANIERQFRALCAGAELRQPDAVWDDPATGEVFFRWDEERLIVVVEPDDEPLEAPVDSV